MPASTPCRCPSGSQVTSVFTSLVPMLAAGLAVLALGRRYCGAPRDAWRPARAGAPAGEFPLAPGAPLENSRSRRVPRWRIPARAGECLCRSFALRTYARHQAALLCAHIRDTRPPQSPRTDRDQGCCVSLRRAKDPPDPLTHSGDKPRRSTRSMSPPAPTTGHPAGTKAGGGRRRAPTGTDGRSAPRFTVGPTRPAPARHGPGRSGPACRPAGPAMVVSFTEWRSIGGVVR
jgi:hypothetical protein